ncbi:hypothetical protein [Lysobacter fragariae]
MYETKENRENEHRAITRLAAAKGLKAQKLPLAYAVDTVLLNP